MKQKKVDVSGVSKGKGFAGVVKDIISKHKMQHTVILAHRAPGSIGQMSISWKSIQRKENGWSYGR